MKQVGNESRVMGQVVKGPATVFVAGSLKVRGLFYSFALALISLMALGGYDVVRAQEYAFSKLSPALSPDGLTVYNAVQPLIVVVDPNPDMQGIKAFGPSAAVALSVPEAAVSTYSITYVAAGGTDVWGQPCIAFPTDAQTAFNAAAAIWANTLHSTVPITIKACWANLGSSSILGYSGGQPLLRNFSGAPKADTWYEGSLANALAGFDLDPSSYDMNITYNNGFSWYFGTDGNPPAGQYDFVSVAAHEICHGLNFSGSASYSAGTGSYGYGGYPLIYDTFIENGSGTPITSYTSGSAALGALLTSNNLWFDGTNADAANGGSRVKVYAPSAWSDGSSFSHLDYSTFAGTSNSLMVYAIGSGSANHNPGTVTIGLLTDLGWQTGSAVGTLSVTPSTGLTSSGTRGGPFSPSSAIYTLQNTGETSINWTVTKGQTWVTLSSASGTLAAGASTTVTVSINSGANSLTPSGSAYVDTVNFANTTNGSGNTTRTVSLTVNALAGTLSVTPSTGLRSSGTEGGPFSPASATYTLQNTGGTPFDWTATKGQTWVTLSSAGGTLAAGASTTVTVSINSGASSLPASGSAYVDSVNFTNTTNGSGNTTRAVSLTVNVPVAGTLSVTPSTGLTSSGMPGGPFSPTSATYIVQNTGGTPIDWTATKGQTWVTLSSAGGTLAAGASATVTVSINSGANSLAPSGSAYSDTVNFTNTTNGSGNTTRAVSLTVSEIAFTNVTVLTPNGGETLMTGSSYEITWGAPATATKFTLQYSLNGGTSWKPIESNVTGTSYNWTVPAQSVNKKKCLIKVIGYNSSGAMVGFDQSNANFLMAVVIVTSPNGGESWNSGAVHPITWTTGTSLKPISKVNIYYKYDSTGYHLITSFIGSNPGTHDWTPALSVKKTACRVKVEFVYTGITAKGNDISNASFTLLP